MQDNKQRVQKILAGLGVASRRKIEEWIKNKQLKINGQIVDIGLKMDPKQIKRVEVAGEKLELQLGSSQPQVKQRLIMYHKPVGEICTSYDEEGRKTVFSSLPKLDSGKWIGVGRLDLNSSGLLLFTTDGTLANKLMHPSSNIEREYAVRILGTLTELQIKKLTMGIKIDDELLKCKKVVDAGGAGANHWYRVILMEGKNREIRRMFESMEFKISRLMRVRFGKLELPRTLEPGEYKELSLHTFD
jgi:23S rRNA pseudouridine2605 synthase